MNLVKEALGDVFQPHSHEELEERRVPYMIKSEDELIVYNKNGNKTLYTLLDDGDGEWRDGWEYLGKEVDTGDYIFKYDEFRETIRLWYISEGDLTTNVMNDIN